MENNKQNRIIDMYIAKCFLDDATREQAVADSKVFVNLSKRICHAAVRLGHKFDKFKCRPSLDLWLVKTVQSGLPKEILIYYSDFCIVLHDEYNIPLPPSEEVAATSVALQRLAVFAINMKNITK